MEVLVMAAESGTGRFLSRWTRRWEIIPLLVILAVNMAIYSGVGTLTAGWHHYDLTLSFDRQVPLIPEFIWIYVVPSYLFWGICYILTAQNGKDYFYRFVACDLTIHLICLLFFVILPTTNVRPEVAGNTLSERFLLLTYQIDGGDLPGNLFPSIHCYVSWLSFRGVKEVKSLPRWFSPASCVMAILIIISTQVLKQHYIVDAIAAVLLVEIFWRFYRTGNRHMGVYRFFEKINSFVWKGKQDL